MKLNRRNFLASGAALSSGLAAPAAQSPAAAAEALLRAGFAERDITPDIGMEQPGGYGKVYLRSFHDPCKVRAAVFGDGASRVALVGVDSLIIPRHTVLAAREGVRSRCGITPRNIMIGASHSHSSGPVGMVLPGEYDHASPLVKKLAYEQSSMADAGYLKRVEEEIVRAVTIADSLRAPSRCSFGVGHEDKAAFNRRFRMKNGHTWTHPGQGNPDIIEPAGPIDPAVNVIGAFDADGRPTGCIVNYACHATTSPGGISANWIYYLERTIQGVFGPGVTVVFLQGFCGDITQVDNRSPWRSPTGDEYARLVGGRVGAEVIKVLLSAHAGAAAPTAAVSEVVQMNRRLPSRDKVQKALAMVTKTPKEVGVTEWTFAKETVMLDALASKWPKLEVEIQAIQVGPAVMVSAPGEMFVQLGLDIRAGSPFPITMPVELANGCVGYIPTEEALGKGGGGYETRLTSYTNAEPAAGTRMVEVGVKLAKQLKLGKMPEPPRAAPFNSDPNGPAPRPWSYGNVPPELS
jgi:neutral ceramidase